MIRTHVHYNSRAPEIAYSWYLMKDGKPGPLCAWDPDGRLFHRSADAELHAVMHVIKEALDGVQEETVGE